MNSPGNTRRFPSWIFPAALFALGVNALLFLLLPFPLNIGSPVPDMTAPVPVNLVQIHEQETPREDEQDVRESKWEANQGALTDFAPDLFQPAIRESDMPRIPADAGPGILTGPAGFVPPGFGPAMVFDEDALDQAPRARLKPPPPYPYKARRREVEGYVQVKFLVDKKGTVGRIRVLEASPEGIFEETVLATLPTWKFSPGEVLGEPVASWVTTTIRFELE